MIRNPLNVSYIISIINTPLKKKPLITPLVQESVLYREEEEKEYDVNCKNMWLIV